MLHMELQAVEHEEFWYIKFFLSVWEKTACPRKVKGIKCYQGDRESTFKKKDLWVKKKELSFPNALLAVPLLPHFYGQLHFLDHYQDTFCGS